MYVRPVARGAKLGVRLVERRIEEAQKKGLSTIFTNTIYINHKMLEIYEGLGFERIPRFPGCYEPIEMDHLLIYLKKEL